ncbi:MAG: glycosyltransferase family 4 protein [Bacteroidaceae bacterium]|nr:glycosyltransferase family 4 protein [Bacteroidaceae bacterium]
MKKILFITNYNPSGGGISCQVDLLRKCLDEEHVETSIFSTKGNVWHRLKAYFKLKRIGKNFDVFHIHACSGFGFLPAVFGVRVGRKLGKRIVLTYHGGGAGRFFDKHPRLVRHFLLRTDVNIVLSGFIAKVFEKHDIPYEIIPNVIELDESKFRQREVIRPSFISIRSFTPTYNIECTLRAFQRVKQQLPDATLTLLGNGPLREDLKEFVRSNDIKDVSFVGVVPNERIYDYLDKADVMLSSPRIDNMPVSILEGMNAGLLVISSRVGGVPYMIEDGQNGLLFDSDDDKEMAEKMMEAVVNEEQSKEMIRKANECVKDYSWENIKDRLFEIYNH